MLWTEILHDKYGTQIVDSIFHFLTQQKLNSSKHELLKHCIYYREAVTFLISVIISTGIFPLTMLDLSSP